MANLSMLFLGNLLSPVLGSLSAKIVPISTPLTPPSRYASIPNNCAGNYEIGTFLKKSLPLMKMACPPKGS